MKLARKLSPKRFSMGEILILNGVWLILLALLAIGVTAKWSLFTHVDDPFHHQVPFFIPWSGCVGGVAASIVALVAPSHAVRPNMKKYGYWHITRPVLGTIFGTVAVLIIVLLLQTVKVQQNTGSESGNVYPASGIATLSIISFVIGYRQDTFKALVERVVDVILTPGPTTSSSVALVPEMIDFGSVAIGTTKSFDVHIFNGSSDTIRLTPAAVSITARPGLTLTPVAQADVSSNSSAKISVTWKPTARARLDSTLHVSIANLSLYAPIVGTAG